LIGQRNRRARLRVRAVSPANMCRAPPKASAPITITDSAINYPITRFPDQLPDYPITRLPD
jgi:hypothetical protein